MVQYMKRFTLLFFILLLIAHCQLFAQLPDGFVQQRLATGLDPTSMDIAPDGRIFITEKYGQVRIVRNGALLPDPFLTIPVDNFNERGLSAIALDADFDRNGYVYVYYTVPGRNINRLSRFTANGDFAIPGSEFILLETESMPGTIHNAGAMVFGTDGKLYISIGDGADAGTAQRLDRLLGKILRINPDGSIPNDNPFYNQTTGIYRAIWARGFRNSYTMAIEPGTGRIFANDVGGDRFEEVNEIVRGGNYGWNIVEGPLAGQNRPDNYQDPVYAYNHAQGCCIIGAAFYNPTIPTFPEQYRGKYFFADYCGNYMNFLNPDNGQVEGIFLTNLNQLVNIRVSDDGDLYYLMRSGIGGGSVQDNTGTTNGSLWRVSYTGSGAPFIAVEPESILLPVGEDAVFSVLAIGKGPLNYQWQRNGVDIPGANEPEFTYPNVALSDDGSVFNCLITNAEGIVMTRSVLLNVTPNTRPLPAITQPAVGATYRAGDTIVFAGGAEDAEDGTLNADQLTWRIDFHHADHTHPALDPTPGIAGGTFVIPRTGEIDDDVFYRIYLTATDQGGLSRTVFRDVTPIKTEFVVTSEPSGLQLNVDGKTVITPHTVTSVEGIRRTIVAPEIQNHNGQLYTFQSWSNGVETDFFTFLAGEVPQLMARYETVELATGKGIGLTGNYYKFQQGQAPESAFAGEPVLTRIDSVINFDWVFGEPAPEVGNDYFAVRWSGRVMPPASGTYTFYANADDGVRLWVNEQLLVDRWVPQAEVEFSGSIELEGGVEYPIRMEYFELGGHAVAQLRWSSRQIPKTIVPATQLFPERPPILGPSDDYAILLSPNPADFVLNLRIDANIRDRVTWHIYDATGREVGSRAEDIARGTNTFEIDISNLASGVYFIKFVGRSLINAQQQFIKH